MVTKVTGKNQVTIPAALARELRIERGTQLEWQRGEGKDTLTIRVKPSIDVILCELQEMAAKYRIDGRMALEDLQQMRDEDDADSESKGSNR